MDNLFIIAGLGNPGMRYENTRHNVGFNVIDQLSDKYNIKVSKVKFKALSGEGAVENKKIILLKPQTYMNLSGESIRDALEWYKIPTANLLIVYDDIDLPLGKIRVRAKGSAGTHNGMRSVIYQIQSDEFPRIRIGIDKPPEGWELADYVLGKFSEHQKTTIVDSVNMAAQACIDIVKSGLNAAMNKYNK